MLDLLHNRTGLIGEVGSEGKGADRQKGDETRSCCKRNPPESSLATSGAQTSLQAE